MNNPKRFWLASHSVSHAKEIETKKRARPLRIVTNDSLNIQEQAKAIHARVERRLRESNKPKTSCAPGCDHCCYKLATIGVPDGLVIAEAIMKTENWKHIFLPKVRETALASCDGMIEDGDWFRKHIPCPLLNTEEGLCLFYEERPTPCRYHFAVTPAEMCDPKQHTGEVAMLDLRKIEDAIDHWQLRVSQRIFGDLAIASLPVMVLHCIGLLTNGDVDVENALEGVTDPRQWIEKHKGIAG